MLISVNNNSLIFKGSVADSFAFDDALTHIFGKDSWSVKQNLTKLVYSIKGSYSEYELIILMKTLEIKTKGKIKYVKYY